MSGNTSAAAAVQVHANANFIMQLRKPAHITDARILEGARISSAQSCGKVEAIRRALAERLRCAPMFILL